MLVWARCEYDAWVTMRVLTGVRVSLEGLDPHDRDWETILK